MLRYSLRLFNYYKMSHIHFKSICVLSICERRYLCLKWPVIFTKEIWLICIQNVLWVMNTTYFIIVKKSKWITSVSTCYHQIYIHKAAKSNIRKHNDTFFPWEGDDISKNFKSLKFKLNLLWNYKHCCAPFFNNPFFPTVPHFSTLFLKMFLGCHASGPPFFNTSEKTILGLYRVTSGTWTFFEFELVYST